MPGGSRYHHAGRPAAPFTQAYCMSATKELVLPCDIRPNQAADLYPRANGYLKKVGSKELEEKWPKAAAILKKINLTNAQIAAAASLVDVDGMTPEDAAKKWIETNQDTVKSWVQ